MNVSSEAGKSAGTSRLEGTHLLVRAGEYACALPLAAVRRVVRALAVHPLPGASAELEGLAEFGGEPLPVLNLARLVRSPAGPNPTYPVTVVVWVGPADAREMLGLACDSALEVVHVPAGSVVAGDGGFVLGEAPVAGEVVRVLNLEALGADGLSVPDAQGFLLLRRGGGLWGIANAAVDGLARQGRDYRITIAGSAGSSGSAGSGGSDLVADEILGVVEELRVWPLAPMVRRFWPEPAAGLAVHGREPVVVVDPARLPAALSAERRAEGSGEGDRPEGGLERHD